MFIVRQIVMKSVTILHIIKLYMRGKRLPEQLLFIISISIIILLLIPRAFANMTNNTPLETIRAVVTWCHFPPYIEALPSANLTNNSYPFGGLFQEIMTNMIDSCSESRESTLVFKNFTETDGPLQFHQNFQSSKESVKNKISFIVPYSRAVALNDKIQHDEYFFIPLILSPGAMHFYKKQAEPVGSDLLTVIIQGWPMLVLILLGAAYSGIIIWLLDRLWNPDNFPKPFLKGFWEGFWWAFVTMTTVGYGDTTPRSVQARIFGLMWIIVGITILSVFTATVTTVLTKESLGTLRNLQGRHIGVIEGSEDHKLAISLGIRPKGGRTIDELVEYIRDEVTEGTMLDQFAFADSQHALDTDIVVDGIIGNERSFGIHVQSGNIPFNECLQKYAAANKNNFFEMLARRIKPLSTDNYKTAAENAQELFQPKTIVLMWYGMAAWVVIFIGFIVWEFTYWRPKHNRKQELNQPNKKSNNESTAASQPSNKSKKEDKKEHSDPKSYDLQVENHVVPLQKYSVNCGTINLAYEHESESTVSSGRTDSQGVSRSFKGLAALIKQQNKELFLLEDQLLGYKQHWENRVKLTQQRHREEQLTYLRALYSLPKTEGKRDLDKVAIEESKISYS